MNVEAGPSGVGLAGTVPVAVGEFSTIVIDGPLSKGALENTMTIAKFASVGEIVFKPSAPSVIEQAEAVAAAAWEKSEPASPRGEPIPQEVVLQPVALPAEEVLVVPQVIPQPEPVVLPAALPQTEPAPKTETRVLSRVSPAISPQPLLQEQEVEETVWEQVRVEDKKEDLEEEEQEFDKRLFLEDEQAAGQRRYEIGQAIQKAKATGEKLGLKKIAGWLVARFLPPEHPGNRSQVVKEKGPDGSYEETVEAIAAAGEFDSASAAEKKFGQIVGEKRPVKQGKEGNPVKNEDVARVFKYRVAKPSTTAYEIVTKRVKKKVQVPVGQVPTQPKTETSLADYPQLQEIFLG